MARDLVFVLRPARSAGPPYDARAERIPRCAWQARKGGHPRRCRFGPQGCKPRPDGALSPTMALISLLLSARSSSGSGSTARIRRRCRTSRARRPRRRCAGRSALGADHRALRGRAAAAQAGDRPADRAPADDVILANSASYGLHLIANGFPWRDGDEVLTMRGDFPSDILPWLGLAHARRDGPPARAARPGAGAGRGRGGDRAAHAAALPDLGALAVRLGDRPGGDRRAVPGARRHLRRQRLAGGGRAADRRAARRRWTRWSRSAGSGCCGPYATGFCWMRPELLATVRLQPDLLALDADLGRSRPRAARPDARETIRAPPATTSSPPPTSSTSSRWRRPLEYLLEHGIEAARRHDDALVQRLIDGLDRRKYRLTSPEAGPRARRWCSSSRADRERAEEI